MHRGYVKMWRTSFDNELYFSEPFTKWQAWSDMILLACYKPRTVHVRGVPVGLKRGELIGSERYLSERWQWSRGKVRRFIDYLSQKTVPQIVPQKSGPVTIISIVNYELYQGNSTEDSTTNSTADGPQTDRRQYQPNNIKKGKKDKNEISNGHFDTFWKEYPRKVGKAKALESWKKYVKSESLALNAIEAVKKQCQSIEWTKENGQYIPHPSTWLNQGRWDDELTYNEAPPPPPKKNAVIV